MEQKKLKCGPKKQTSEPLGSGQMHLTFILLFVGTLFSSPVLSNVMKDKMICPEPDAIYALLDDGVKVEVYWRRLKFEPKNWTLHQGFPTTRKPQSVECSVKNERLTCIHSGRSNLVQVVDFKTREQIMHQVGHEPIVSKCYDF